MVLTHGSLFSGIGGFDLASEWMGWNNIFHCELNEFGRKILKYYWPNAITYEDITKTDFSVHRGTIDVLTGGFPCQPFSMAGKRKGTTDNRYLWPEMLRAIREMKPIYIVGENVYGLVNWHGGVVFNKVQSDLESEGYEVQPVILPDCGKGAPHKRERIWFVAHSQSLNKQWNRLCEKQQKGKTGGQSSKINKRRTSTDTERSLHKETNGKWKASWAYYDGRWPTQSPICSRDDGFSSKLDGITFPKWRTESLKGYGNAIVPQVAYEIFKIISNEVIN